MMSARRAKGNRDGLRGLRGRLLSGHRFNLERRGALFIIGCVNGASANPPELPVEPPPPAVFPMTEMNSAKRTWNLTLHPRHIALSDPNGVQAYTIPHEEMMTSATVIEGMSALALTKPVKLTFKLPRETLAALVGWIGRPTLARSYLKRRYAWVLPVAVLWVLGSLPIPGDPATGQEGHAIDPVGIGLGVALVFAWAWAKWRPHPALFLFDSLWFLVMAGHLAVDVANGRASKGWLLLVALLVWLVLTGFRHFVRFKGVRLAAKG